MTSADDFKNEVSGSSSNADSSSLSIFRKLKSQKLLIGILLLIGAYVVYKRLSENAETADNKSETAAEKEIGDIEFGEDSTPDSESVESENVEIPEPDSTRGGLNQDRAFIEQVHEPAKQSR